MSYRKYPKYFCFCFNSYLIGVLSREILDRRNNSLSNQLTIGGRGLLLDKLRLLAADWSKQAKAKEYRDGVTVSKSYYKAFSVHE